jgi:hypothetical protein
MLVESVGPDIPNGARRIRSTQRMICRRAMISGEKGGSLHVSKVPSCIRRFARRDRQCYSVRHHVAPAGDRSSLDAATDGHRATWT